MDANNHRLDELEKDFRECRDNVSEKMVRLEVANAEKLTRLETQMLSVAASLETFVSQHQFAPVRLITYGLAGGVLTTFLGAVMAKLLGAF